MSTTTSALVRIAGRKAANSRVLRAAVAGGQATLRSFRRVAHLLFLQITGVFFMFFALAGGIALHREYRAYAAGRIGPGKAVVAFCFVLVFAWFGLSSFWRAKRR
jgi:hypothetical protein